MPSLVCTACHPLYCVRKTRRKTGRQSRKQIDGTKCTRSLNSGENGVRIDLHVISIFSGGQSNTKRDERHARPKRKKTIDTDSTSGTNESKKGCPLFFRVKKQGITVNILRLPYAEARYHDAHVSIMGNRSSELSQGKRTATMLVLLTW